MKKSKRTWLLLAGVAALSATLLVPTVLSACSSTPENENPGDGNKPGDGDGDGNKPGGDEQPKPNKLAEELQKLNETSNKSARKNIYTDYFKAVNKSKTARLSGLTPPTISKPTVKPLTEIVKKSGFFDDLISMINQGLDVVDSSPQNNQISKSDLTQIITDLNNEKNNMNAQGVIPNTNTELTPGSIWSPSAFEFNDVDTATWTYISQNKNTVYELYLTENVDFVFASTSDSVSVKVSNKPGSDKTRSRLVVTKKVDAGARSGSTPATYQSSSYNFKADVEFALPSMLFEDFDGFMDSFNKNVNELKSYINESTGKYKKLADDATKGFAAGATIWNQFVSTNDESLLETIKSDLNTKRSKSKIFEWVQNNVNATASANQDQSTSIVDDFKKDLDAAKSVDVVLDTLTITGKSADNNGLNNATGEKPDYTLIISFDAEESTQSPGQKNGGAQAEPTLDEKWYILNLKATEFKFENTVNSDFFGYQDASFITKPKLKLDAKSEFGSYQLSGTGDSLGGNELATVTKLKGANLKQKDQLVDVSNIYDIDGMGFSSFISSLVIDRQDQNTQLTDNLIDVNTNSSANTLTKFRKYFNTNKEQIKADLLKPDVLADLILENIDINNLAFRSQKFNFSDSTTTSTDTFPTSPNIMNGNIKGWKNIINDWVKGGSNSSNDAKPNVTIKGTTVKSTSSGTGGDNISTTLQNAADIVVQAKPTSGSKVPAHPLKLGNGNKDHWFRSIYIFLGNETNAETLVSGAKDENKSAGLNVDLKTINAPELSSDKQWEAIKNLAQNKFCVIFEKAKIAESQNSTTPPVYGFYMGQRKVMTTNRSSTQSKFSISLDSLLGDGTKFLQTLLAK